MEPRLWLRENAEHISNILGNRMAVDNCDSEDLALATNMWVYPVRKRLPYVSGTSQLEPIM
jgi:hypothetical protein